MRSQDIKIGETYEAKFRGSYRKVVVVAKRQPRRVAIRRLGDEVGTKRDGILVRCVTTSGESFSHESTITSVAVIRPWSERASWLAGPISGMRTRTAQRVEFRTDGYEFAHGRAPRGHGGWAFEFFNAEGQRLLNPGAAHCGGDLAYAWFAPSGTYAEAKSWARGKARALGATDVEVCT